MMALLQTAQIDVRLVRFALDKAKQVHIEARARSKIRDKELDMPGAHHIPNRLPRLHIEPDQYQSP